MQDKLRQATNPNVILWGFVTMIHYMYMHGMCVCLGGSGTIDEWTNDFLLSCSISSHHYRVKSLITISFNGPTHFFFSSSFSSLFSFPFPKWIHRLLPAQYHVIDFLLALLSFLFPSKAFMSRDLSGLLVEVFILLFCFKLLVF